MEVKHLVQYRNSNYDKGDDGCVVLVVMVIVTMMDKSDKTEQRVKVEKWENNTGYSLS